MKIQEFHGHWTPTRDDKAWKRYSARAKDMQPAVDLCNHTRTAVQAGGNIGAWPIWLSHHFLEVLTFEPERKNYVCLERNTTEYNNIEPHWAALADEPGFADLNVCKSIGSHHLVMKPGATRLLTIDGFKLECCDLIVLDIEGAEALALRGAADTLARCKPVVMLEDRGHGEKKGFGLTFDDVVAALPGYKVHTRIGRDVIFTHAE